MRTIWLAFLFGLVACKGEQPSDTDTNDTNDTNDTDTDVTVVDDGDFDHATPVTFDDYGGYAAADNLDKAGDRDFYKIDATAGQDYVIFAMGATGGAGDPDTVVQVFGPDQAKIGENDDLPYRIDGTDAGFVFRARETGTYYVEVLEWADWAGESPNGGTGFDYTLVVAEQPAEPNEDGGTFDNDTIEQEKANLDTLTDTDDTNNRYSWSQDLWTAVMQSQDQSYYFATGAISAPGDVDTYGFGYDYTDTTSGDFLPGAIEISNFPGLDSNLNAVLEFYDAEGNLIASTNDAEIKPDYVGIEWDVGLNVPILTPGDYFVQVKDADGKGSATSSYALIAEPVVYNTDVVTFHDVDFADETVTSDSTPLTMTGSTTTDGLYYGFAVGEFEDASDDFDSFMLTDGVFADQYVYVGCATAVGGSQARVNIDLVDQEGNVLESADKSQGHDDDPSIIEYKLGSSVTQLYLVVNRDSGNDAAGAGAYYQCYIGSDTTDDSANL